MGCNHKPRLFDAILWLKKSDKFEVCRYCGKEIELDYKQWWKGFRYLNYKKFVIAFIPIITFPSFYFGEIIDHWMRLHFSNVGRAAIQFCFLFLAGHKPRNYDL